jgi:hypothetical protein
MKTRPKVKKPEFRPLCWYCSRIHCYYPSVPPDALHAAHQPAKEKVIESKPRPKIHLGRLEPETFPRDGLKKVYAVSGKPPVTLAGTSPAEVLVWCDQLREVHAGRRQFLTRAALMNYATHYVHDGYEVVYATIDKLYEDEGREEAALIAKWEKDRVEAAKKTEVAKEPEVTAVNTAREVAGIQIEQSTKNGTTRTKVFGVPATAVIRWAAWEGWKEVTVDRLLRRLGITNLKENTFRMQFSSGQKGNDGPHGEIPELTDEQGGRLLALVRERKKKKKKLRR